MSIDRRLPWLMFGWLALYVPSYHMLVTRVWTDSEEMHGPIVLAVALWALWSLRGKLQAVMGQASAWTWPILLLGLAAYFVGRVLEIPVLEIGSQVLVVTACLLLLGGWRAVRLAAFPLAFLVFMVPLPGNFVDAATGALKQVVSSVAESLLYWAGYPVARSGVIISVGPYQMMVADACSGLKSMFSLSAMGLLYVYLMGHANALRNALLILALLPIAFAANVVRVIILILVTYHFGDAAGQGFIHDTAGIVLFVVAILLLSVWDSVLGRLMPAVAGSKS